MLKALAHGVATHSISLAISGVSYECKLLRIQDFIFLKHTWVLLSPFTEPDSAWQIQKFPKLSFLKYVCGTWTLNEDKNLLRGFD